MNLLQIDMIDEQNINLPLNRILSKEADKNGAASVIKEILTFMETRGEKSKNALVAGLSLQYENTANVPLEAQLRDCLTMWGVLYNTPPLLTNKEEWDECFKKTLKETCRLLK